MQAQIEYQQRLAPKTLNYSYGPYNKFNDSEQWIRVSEGCPNQCPYCYEPAEFKVFPIPDIVRNEVRIMDMNLLAKPEAKAIIRELGAKRVQGKQVNYQLICGIDYRFLDDETAKLLKVNHFTHIRIAWDWWFKDQLKIKDAIGKLTRVGYKPRDVMIFMICNWKIPYEENLQKLDLCKVWNVQVSDCYYDNQTGPNFTPVFWTMNEIKNFRHRCRKHNQLVNFHIDPEVTG